MDGLKNNVIEPLITDKKNFEVYSSYTYFADQDVLLAKITPCFENGKLEQLLILLMELALVQVSFRYIDVKANITSIFILFFQIK